MEYNIMNVCKPPSSPFTPTAIPTFLHPSLNVGDFNCQHVNWGYNTSPDGENLESWATSNNIGLLYDPKETASFLLSPMERRHEPRPGLREQQLQALAL